MLRIPNRAPRANAVCERFSTSVRHECLDHTLILNELQLYRVVKEYISSFSASRPHQGIGQQMPEQIAKGEEERGTGKFIAFPVLNGLHHDYPDLINKKVQPGRPVKYVNTGRPGPDIELRICDGFGDHCLATTRLLIFDPVPSIQPTRFLRASLRFPPPL